MAIHYVTVVVVVQSALCDLVDCSRPGFPVFHYLLEFAQIHVHWVGDAIWPSYPLPPSSPFAFNLYKQQSFPMNQLFASGCQSIGISALASVLPKDTQDWSPLERTGLITISKIQLTNNQFISTFSHYLYNVLRNWIIFCVCVQDPIKNHISHFIVFSFHSSLI